MSVYVLDLETAPLGSPPPCPEEWAAKGIQDAWKPETIERRRTENQLTWEAEWRKRAALDWRQGRITCIGITDGVTPYVICDLDEKGMLEALWGISATSTPLMVGYNIKRFDWPWLLGRSAVHGIRPSVRVGLQPWDTKSCIDLADWLSPPRSIQEQYRMRLRDYAVLFGLPAPEGDGHDMPAAWAAGDYQTIKDHCAADLVTTWALWERLEPVYR